MRKTLGLLAFALLFAAPSLAQRTAISITTVGSLPATCTAGVPYIVTDGTDGDDCSTGSGSTQHICFCNATGNGYNAQPTSAANSFGTIGTATADSGGDTATAGANDGLGLSTDTTNDPEDISISYDYSLTLAGNPALAVDTCTFSSTATGACFICEGSVDNTNEQLYCFPDADTADTTYEIIDDTTSQTLANKTLTTPTIGDFSNAGHNHSNAANGGDVALGSGSTATTAAADDNDTSPATTAWVQTELTAERLAFGNERAMDIFVDGTQCQQPFGQQIASGPLVGVIECADNAGSIIYGSFKNENYAGGTLVFTMHAVNTNATPSGILSMDFDCQCRGNDDLMNSTWGTAQEASITFATQNDFMEDDTPAATCNGTCAAGDTVFWRAVMDSATTTTQVADTRITSVSYKEQ